MKSLFMLLGLDRDGRHEWPGPALDPEGLVRDIIVGIETIEDGDAKQDVIRELLEMLARIGSGPTDYRQGELAHYNDDIFHPVRYIGRDRSWIFSADFSSIGRIDILIKDLPDGCFISIFCENSALIAAFKEKHKELSGKIALDRSPVYINYYNMRDTVNKIVEIYLRYSRNSVFDVKA